MPWLCFHHPVNIMVTQRYPLPLVGTPVLPGVSANKLVLSMVKLNALYDPPVAPVGTVCL